MLIDDEKALVKGLKSSLEVSDNGIGIAANDLPRIFEGLFRSEPSRSKEIEGYGMGLAIVKRIAALHGWDISADSRPEKGTTIILTIPLKKPVQKTRRYTI